MSKQHFHTPHVVPAHAFEHYPLNWEQIFQRRAPLSVEIGFGNGEFLVNWAKQHPDWNFVGIDHSLGSTERLQKRLLQNSIKNVRIINDDARFTLRELFWDNCLQHVIVNFPDPWPKKHHKERRILLPAFIQTLGAVLEIQGTFELVTDQFWLAKETHSLFSESPLFELKQLEKNPARFINTKYEKRWRDSGSDTYQLISTKKKNSSITRILEDAQMPHTLIKKEIVPDHIHRFANFKHSEENKLFVIKEIFTDFKKNKYLLQVITKDFDYQQNFYVLITKHQNNWLVKLDETSQAYRTPVVKLVVMKIGELLS